MSVEDLGSFNPASNLFGEESNNDDKKQRNIIRMIFFVLKFGFPHFLRDSDDNLFNHSNTTSMDGEMNESVLVFLIICFDEQLSVIVTLSLYLRNIIYFIL